MKHKIIALIYKFPIIKGIVKKIEGNHQRILKLEQKNKELKKTQKALQHTQKKLNATRALLDNALAEINTLKQTTARLSKDLERTNTNLLQNTRDQVQSVERMVRQYMPDDKRREALSNWYYRRIGEKLNLDNPQTFNEKIQWMKLYDSPEMKLLKGKLADKYEVRKFVKERIGEEYLIPLLGVWKNFDDIDFEKLPDRFALKATHGSAMNVIVTDKSQMNLGAARYSFRKWLATNYAYTAGFEMHYENIEPRIIAEEYISEADGLLDYKFMCFNGEVKYIWVDTGRYTNHCRDLFDTNWNHIDIRIAKPNAEFTPKAPENLNKMLELASKLCQGFPHVRVDLYSVFGKIYFGEMTFTSGNGGDSYSDKEFAKHLGSLIPLP